MDEHPKKRKDGDAVTLHTDSTINSHVGLNGLSNDTIEERILYFPSIKMGDLTVNDLYVTTASLSAGIGSALLKHVSLIIDAPKKCFVFLPHDGQQEIFVGNKETGSLSFCPSEAGDTLGVLKAIVRRGSIAYQKGIRTGDYLIEVDGTPITDICTYVQMEGKDKDTPMKFRSPDGTVKQATLKRTY